MGVTDRTRAAILTVKIKNTGIAAYQHELYGDSVLVERHFSRSGGSGFKLKSATGKLISTRKSDLDEICDYFALQIDNPMNVLTQDMARQFLNSSNASDKYKFFMKGTQLEHLDADYRQMEESIDQIEDDLEKIKKDVEQYREDADKKRKLQAMSERYTSLRSTIRDMARQMAWAQVEEEEQRLARRDEDIRKAQNSVADAESREEQAVQAFDMSEHAMELVNVAVQDAHNELNPLNEEKEEAKRRFDLAKSEALDAQVGWTLTLNEGLLTEMLDATKRH